MCSNGSNNVGRLWIFWGKRWRFQSVGIRKSDDSGEIYMFISQPEYADAIGELIDEYKKVAPNVTINYETTQNDYPTLLKAKLNSGETLIFSPLLQEKRLILIRSIPMI